MSSASVAEVFVRTFRVSNYDLAATLASGQAFRWRLTPQGWTGVVHRHWVRLRQDRQSLIAQTAQPVGDWGWLESYLQLEVEVDQVLRAFPDDPHMRVAVESCRGLRLLRQDPWECLASFILSSTKQIVQIQQIVAALTERFGDPLATTPEAGPAFSFPSADRIAGLSEAELRDCKMGFRAPYLRESAQAIAGGQFDLTALRQMSSEAARFELLRLPGIGPKIANCVLLFAYGFQDAFPVDVWVMKALRELYFPGRRVTERRIHEFANTYFGSYAGYAQQYLFHYIRTRHTVPTNQSESPKFVKHARYPRMARLPQPIH